MKIIERRILKLEERFGTTDDQPVGEPTIINLSFVDKELGVVGQMQMPVPLYPKDALRRGRRFRY
jgi:hypothetical protein